MLVLGSRVREQSKKEKGETDTLGGRCSVRVLAAVHFKRCEKVRESGVISRSTPLHGDRCCTNKVQEYKKEKRKKKARFASVQLLTAFSKHINQKAKGSFDLPSTSLHHHHYPSTATTATATAAVTTTTASMIKLFIFPIYALTHSSGHRPSPSQHRLFLLNRPFFFFAPPFLLQVSSKFFGRGSHKTRVD